MADRVHELKRPRKGWNICARKWSSFAMKENLKRRRMWLTPSLKKMSVEDIAEVIKVNIETVKSWLASTTAAR